MALELRHDSLEDFLAWEERQPERYERVAGARLRQEALDLDIGLDEVFARVDLTPKRARSKPRKSART
jgi:hypothetical protein